MFITRRADFSASHAMHRTDWSDQRNREMYGAASNPHGHGHNYVLEVTLEGEPDPVTGMVMDLKALKAILEREVVQPFDHRFLNREVEPFDRIVPTPENIAIEIWRRLQPHFHGAGPRLHNVRLFETEDLFVDYAGETAAS
jgi:6-pyruvoyltetrahydropterin/6-carboxytetrahydropterin synthase